MDLSKLISVGDNISLNLLKSGILRGKCIDTSVVEFERKYLLRFEDGSEKWVTNYFLRHMSGSN